MADAPAFEWMCEQLDARTSLSRLEARGTLRLTLKGAGLDATRVTPSQMQAAVSKILPDELAARGVEDPQTLCRDLSAGVLSVGVGGSGAESPEDVFRRLGSG